MRFFRRSWMTSSRPCSNVKGCLALTQLCRCVGLRVGADLLVLIPAVLPVMRLMSTLLRKVLLLAITFAAAVIVSCATATRT